MLFYLGLESGQHVEIIPMFSVALDSRVVNMMRLYGKPLYLGFESGQQVELQLMCSCILDSRVVNMFTHYPCFPSALDSRVVNMLRF